MSEEKTNVYFVELVSALAGSAMQQLGKIANIMTGKVEKDLKGAKATIDMIAMIKEKTKGNLNEEESKMLLSILTNLQLNYVDETKDEKKVEEKVPENDKKEEDDKKGKKDKKE
ncbi:MAG: DUF1844 domain-containing protein [Candidatus Ancaeobacter aquaticus]|nr:DUF1844 domain-containing protein [Candidatus Ancaeobacter aquaticus]